MPLMSPKRRSHIIWSSRNITAQSGATAPAPLAGMLAQTTAKLCSFNDGEPDKAWPSDDFFKLAFVVDLRTVFAGSGGEISVLNAAAAQISNALGFISGVASQWQMPKP